MRRHVGAILILVAAVLFLIANRAAYRGYFQDDEIDNVSWTPETDASDFARALVSPVIVGENFRPTGHYYFRIMAQLFGLRFPPYVAGIHALHLLNVWLLWLLLRKLGADTFAASIAALLLGFHMALFDAYWKPMYVFDILCATFTLLCLLFWVRRNWILSFVAFWLAYKSKELAVMLPAALACYEFWLGKRQWKPLIPFFVVSLSFGLQALLANHKRADTYTFHFSLDALKQTIPFYSSRLLLVPWAGLGVLLLPAISRERRVWFGMSAMALLMFPLLFLPGRLFSAYWYVPLIGISIAVSALVLPRYRVVAVLLCFVWIPWNLYNLRLERRTKLASDQEVRTYITTLARFTSAHPRIAAFVYDGAPTQFNRWGIEAALRMFTHYSDIPLRNIDDAEAGQALSGPSVALLKWEPTAHQLRILSHGPGDRYEPYIRMGTDAPRWQLTQGWYSSEGDFRWSKPFAEARLGRPAGARQFELRVNVNAQLLRAVGPVSVEVRLDGQSLGRAEYKAEGWQTVRWNLPPSPAGTSRIEFHVSPGYQSPDGRLLGIAVVGFGFVPSESA